MTQPVSRDDRRRYVSAVPLIAALCGLALCGCAGAPAKHDYVLGAAAAPTPASKVQTAMPTVQIERVRIPDYLDNRDIVTRADNQLVPSETGRWAERLSVGVTRALAQSVASRLQGAVVTFEQPLEPPVLRVLVDVTTLEATPSRQVVLAARWTITDGPGEKSLAAEQATVTQSIAGGGSDAATVAAMSQAVADLANRIGAAIDQAVATNSRPGNRGSLAAAR